MSPLPLSDRLADRADSLRLLVCGAQTLLDDVLSDMRHPSPFIDRVAVVAALLEAIEGKARELGQICEEAGNGA